MRGRVLVIGEPRVAQRAISELNQLSSHAADIFDALGQLAASSAREPIVAVVLVSSNIGSSMHEAATAIRKLDPAVPLVLLHSGELDESETHALASVIDEMVLIDDAEHLRRAVDGQGSPGSTSAVPSGRTAPLERAGRNDALVVETTLRPVEAELAALPGNDAASARVRAGVKPVPPLSTSGPPGETTVVAASDFFMTESGVSTRDRLGDIDLIDAILHDPAALESRAIRLIAQQTGFDDLQLLHDAPAKPKLSSAGVRLADRSFGILASALARPEELVTWADWLARWLAMGESHARNREWAYRDELTDAWNRRYFNEFLAQVIRAAQQQRRPVTLMLFDLDDFKRYNDQFGHDAGDEILRETVKLLTSVIRKGDRVCRIGGDEFAVIFADPEGPRETGSTPPETVEQIARRFQDQICAMKFPKLAAEAPGPLTISAGLATYPWDGHDPASLLKHADELALASKRRGKNVMTLGPGAAGANGEFESDTRAG